MAVSVSRDKSWSRKKPIQLVRVEQRIVDGGYVGFGTYMYVGCGFRIGLVRGLNRAGECGRTTREKEGRRGIEARREERRRRRGREPGARGSQRLVIMHFC